MHAGEDGKEPAKEPANDASKTPDSKPSVSKPGEGLGDLSIEDLLQIKVTSVSRKEERLADTPSAIYLITQEDIRRSGVTTIADALRMAPGMNVSQVNSHTWAISTRGFQSILANKLLVLIDGRSVYSPLYSGVYWDVQDTMLEDIDRIEVIRGPGATVWGANAVNGVVNIITKNSKDTQGVLSSLSAGTKDETIDSFRYGGKINEKVSYRAYMKYSQRDGQSKLDTGTAAYDAWDDFRTGTRFDIAASKHDKIVVSGDYYYGTYQEAPVVPKLTAPFSVTIPNDAERSGGNLLSRWEHSFSDSSNTSLQFYYDRTDRREVKLHQGIDTLDLDFNHHLKTGRHDIVYGAGVRHIKEDLGTTFSIDFTPDDRVMTLASAFAQDEITVVENKFSVTIGTKLEHNDFTGYEIQPSVKTMWHPAKNHSIWTSVSRAVRTPSPIETDIRGNLLVVPIGEVSLIAALFPTPGIPPETVVASEIGYRAQLHKRFSLDVAAFHNIYDNLRSNEAGAAFLEETPAPAHFTLPVRQRPLVEGTTFGSELSATWQPIDRLKFNLGYAYLQMLLHREARAKATDAEIAEGQTPDHQFHVRAAVDLPHHLQFDTAVFFYDRRETGNVASYARLDARLGWQPTKNFDVSIGAQNMARQSHIEFADPATAKIERNAYIRLTLKF